MGNKSKLINRGLCELFPKNINTFIDLFCGSGIVSLNVESRIKIINDKDKNIISLIEYFKNNDPNFIIETVDNLILKYNLPTFSTDARVYKGDRSIFKNNYNKLRNDYNLNRDISLLYVLNIFSNSHMIRFNSNGDFNMPFGNGYFTDECRQNILNNTYKNIDYIYNEDFMKLNYSKISLEDFVYLDPPYLNTNANYNENNGWTEEEENDMYNLCEILNKNGIKWGMSNVFYNKGHENNMLIEWCNKNNWNVFHFDNFSYCACGKGNSNSKEVFIYNY